MEMLSRHRGGLNAIARALLDNEIIDGAEVARLVDEAHGSPVHSEGAKSVPHFHEAAINAPAANGANGAGNGHAPHPRPRPTKAPSPCRPPPPHRRPTGPIPTPGPRRCGPRRPTPPPAGRRDPPPVRHGAQRIEPIRSPWRHGGGWWTTSSQSGSRTGTSPRSAPPA